MTDSEKKYYAQKLSALRNAIDEVVRELGLIQTESAPRKRRNLRQQRLEELETNYALGSVRKPSELRKHK